MQGPILQEIRRFPGYRSRFAPVNSTVPAVTWPDVGQTWRWGKAFGRLLSVGCEGYGTLSHEECRRDVSPVLLETLVGTGRERDTLG